MKECFIPREFRYATLGIIRKANLIIQDYQAQGYKLTLRQLYYQFVQRNWIANKQSEYKRLGDILNDARLAGLVDWDAIEDRTRNLRPTPMWDDPAQFLQDWGRHYKEDPWRNQPTYCEVWIEKDALMGVVERPCSKWRVPYFACRGYVSASEMYDAAKRLQKIAEMGQQVVVVHLGDHDPSGTQMTDDVTSRIELLSREMEGIEVRRIALTMAQINEHNPPPNPAKESDSRFKGYFRRYGTDKSWELDALNPKIISDLISNEIESLVDIDLYNRDIADEKPYRDRILKAGRLWSEMISRVLDGSEFYHDLTTHRDQWLAALDDHAGTMDNEADRSYWQHERMALERVLDALTTESPDAHDHSADSDS